MDGTVLGGSGDDISVIPVFTTMVQLVSSHLVIFILMVRHLNLIILPFLSILEYTLFKSISKRRGKKTKIHQATRIEGQA